MNGRICGMTNGYIRVQVLEEFHISKKRKNKESVITDEPT